MCFSQSDACHLPYEDNFFDQVVISFATRNVGASKNGLIPYFKEFLRILKPGGTFINLETSQPKNLLIKKLFHFYAGTLLPVLGYLLSGEKSPYRFLSSTMISFLDSEQLKSKLLKAGFNQVEVKSLTCGICALHIAKK
ncbi:MAG: class I SAM-dependent methyltransferase [Candidatus Omnitrophica bacterium]|nr:class I SAM-dependent methyltransferase [Candidatus Omnitrophota bacterium]